MAIHPYMKSFKKFIFPSTYIEKKKRSFYRVVGKKIFTPLLSKSKKEVILLHSDENNLK
jgi:hypothetical protein